MKYETPELTVLTAAVDAIKGNSSLQAKNRIAIVADGLIPTGHVFNEHTGVGYADWE